MTRRVLVSDAKTTDVSAVEDELDGLDAEVAATVAHRESRLLEEAAGAEALIVDANTPVNERVLNELEGLRAVGRAGIGVDNVAIDVAEANDVAVVHVPEYCVDEVSTHAMALLLDCVRRISLYDRSVKRGEWEWPAGRPIERLAGSTVGLYAFGKIARRTAEKLSGFGVDVIAHDPYVEPAAMAEREVEPVGWDELLARSDALSIHAPNTDETRGAFDADAFAAMKESAILVNTARGPIVDEDDLLAALEDGEIDSAGLDVREPEPPEDSPLHGREDVVLSPHVAWYSEASRVDLSASVARDVAAVLRGDDPENRVDPESGWF